LAKNAGFIVRKLVIFNLETDSQSPVLAVGIDWIVELSKHFESTQVVSTKVGDKSRLKNIKVVELGGGNLRQRLLAIIKLTLLSLPVLMDKSSYLIFHHMSPRTAVFPGILFRVFGIRQGLWYSHASTPISLKIAIRIVNQIFTSTKQSIPIGNAKTNYVGHGIPINKFRMFSDTRKRMGKVLYVGRISKVKRLDVLIREMAKLRAHKNIVYVGPEHQGAHARELQALAQAQSVELEMRPSVSYGEVPKLMASFKYFYSGTKGSVDKVALEAALSGCFVITLEQTTIDLTGMSVAWDVIGKGIPRTISGQIQLLESLEAKECEKIRRKIIENCQETTNLTNTVSKIVTALRGQK
jgi:glycosyltransferase involved in cell wall biosynthesis